MSYGPIYPTMPDETSALRHALLEIERYKKALDKACEYIAELTESCPYDVHEVELDYCIDCQTECAKCWKEWCMKDD